MKKQMMDFVRAMGGSARYCGTWPSTLYITSAKGSTHVDEIIGAALQRFTRHTPIRLAHG